MIEVIFNYLNHNDINPPATKEQIELAQEKLGVVFPARYVDFLLKSDGYEGLIGQAYIALWNIDDIVKRNEGYAVKEFAPHLVLFGSDGGDEAFAFDTSKSEFPIVITPFIGLGLEEENVIGNSFFEFIENLYNGCC
jgi:hypothetical protein